MALKSHNNGHYFNSFKDLFFQKDSGFVELSSAVLGESKLALLTLALAFRKEGGEWYQFSGTLIGSVLAPAHNISFPVVFEVFYNIHKINNNIISLSQLVWP